MVHGIQLALGEFMHSLCVKGHTKSWEAYECDNQFGENKRTDMPKSQRLPKEGNTRNNKVAAMRSGLAKVIEKLHISTYVECTETHLYRAENAYCIDYADTWSSKRVH
jgi:hypothetical protein